MPFAVLILRAFMLSLPYELTEAAFVDGAGEWGAFLRIMLPLAVPGVVTAGLFAFLFAWGDFIYALTLTTSNTIEPVSLSIYQLSRPIQQRLGQRHGGGDSGLDSSSHLAHPVPALYHDWFNRRRSQGLIHRLITAVITAVLTEVLTKVIKGRFLDAWFFRAIAPRKRCSCCASDSARTFWSRCRERTSTAFRRCGRFSSIFRVTPTPLTQHTMSGRKDSP